MVNAAFNMLFGFVGSIFSKFGLWVLAKWNMRVAAVTFYITATSAALVAFYLGAGALLGQFITSFPPDSIFYGFLYMMITPNVPACITAVAAAWVLLKAYEWFITQARMYQSLVGVM